MVINKTLAINIPLFSVWNTLPYIFFITVIQEELSFWNENGS